MGEIGCIGVVALCVGVGAAFGAAYGWIAFGVVCLGFVLLNAIVEALDDRRTD